jgi:hypothetical protein
MFLLLVDDITLSNPADAEAYDMDQLQYLIEDNLWVKINDDNKQALKNYIVITNNKYANELNNSIHSLIDDIFKAVSVKDTEGKDVEIIKLNDVIIKLQNIVTMLKNG